MQTNSYGVVITKVRASAQRGEEVQARLEHRNGEQARCGQDRSAAQAWRAEGKRKAKGRTTANQMTAMNGSGSSQAPRKNAPMNPRTNRTMRQGSFIRCVWAQRGSVFAICFAKTSGSVVGASQMPRSQT